MKVFYQMVRHWHEQLKRSLPAHAPSPPRQALILLLGSLMLSVVVVVSLVAACMPRPSATPATTIHLRLAAATPTASATDTRTTTRTAINAQLAVPSQLTATPDDRNAIVTWNGGPAARNQNDPADVVGYVVTWGPASSPAAHSALTSYRAIQLQPLVNGQPYVATVQSEDMHGKLSVPSAPVTFTGNSARVDALRQQMNGFFDDFNRPEGQIDLSRWSTAVSYCNYGNPALNTSFINTQYHTHNIVSDTHCDRGQLAQRPYGTFDFTNRTGTIAFDMDGETGARGFWYLDLMPSPVDINGHADIDGTLPSYPLTFFRISLSGDVLTLFNASGNGVEQPIATTNWSPYPPLGWAGVPTIPNLRRHWLIHLSQTHIDIQVDGKTVMASDKLSLSFSKASLLWTLFAYNNAKGNFPYELIHWDNFGFDAPPGSAPSVVTHNYLDANYNGGNDWAWLTGWNNQVIASKQITIPDGVTGATAERLLFTLQAASNQNCDLSGTNTVSVNGFTIPIKPLNVPQSVVNNVYGSLTPLSYVYDLPLGTLKTGSNSVVFTMRNCGVLNVHTELDFPAHAAPAYTQPVYAALPTETAVGQTATVYQIGDVQMWKVDNHSRSADPIAVSGTEVVHMSVSCRIQLGATGGCGGTGQVELLLDGKVIWSQNTDGNGAGEPIAAGDFTYSLDTTRLSNGTHNLEFKAFDEQGVPSIPDIFDLNESTGDPYFYPLKVNNAAG